MRVKMHEPIVGRNCISMFFSFSKMRGSMVISKPREVKMYNLIFVSHDPSVYMFCHMGLRGSNWQDIYKLLKDDFLIFFFRHDAYRYQTGSILKQILILRY